MTLSGGRTHAVRPSGAGLRLACTRALALAVLSLGQGLTVAEEIHQHGMGFIRESDAVYQSFPTVPRFRAFLPEQVDLSGRFPVPGNQGQQGSCTAWATGYALRSYYEGRKHPDESLDTAEQVFSPAYIYNRLHPTGNCQEGTAISDALDLLKHEGVPPLSEFPYSEEHCSLKPDRQVRRDAGHYRIKSWRAIEASKLDDVKGQLASGNPVVFGLDISDSFNNLSGDMVYDDVASPRIGGHAMVVVGYDERRQAFRLFNSWGTDWGDNGFAWASYRVVKAHAERYFVMNVPEEPAPQPQPQPAPEPAPPPVVVIPPVPAPQPEPQPEPPPVVVIPPVPAPQPEPPTPPVPQPPTPPVVVIPPVPPPTPPVPVPTPPPPVVLPSLEETRQAVTKRLEQVQCAHLTDQVTQDRTVHLSGFAGSAADVAKLRAELAALPGVAKLTDDVSLRPWPQCEVLLSFAQALTLKDGLSVQLAGMSADQFRQGDSLKIDVVTPDYPSYLYVTYLQASGEAVHLSWPEGRFPKSLPPHTHLTFGGGANGQPVYRVVPPFGDEIVVVVASASPLFQDELPEKATDREYLTSFRRAFLVEPKAGGGGRVISAAVATLKTEPAK